jgi:hypothetical protein
LLPDFLYFLKIIAIPGDDEIAVEEIVVNGEPVMTGDGFLDPSQLCSIQITGNGTSQPEPLKSWSKLIFCKAFTVFVCRTEF